jgi:hypothetical protein
MSSRIRHTAYAQKIVEERLRALREPQHQVAEHRCVGGLQRPFPVLAPGELDHCRSNASIRQRRDRLRKVLPAFVFLPYGDELVVDDVAIPAQQAGERGEALLPVGGIQFHDQSFDPLARHRRRIRRGPHGFKLRPRRRHSGKEEEGGRQSKGWRASHKHRAVTATPAGPHPMWIAETPAERWRPWGG